MAGRRSGRRRERARATTGRRLSQSVWAVRLGPALVGLALPLLVWAPPLAAQTIPDALHTLPGQNDPQDDMARAIEQTCPFLNPESPDPDTARLKSVCDDMIGAAQGEDPPTDDLNASLQSLNGEELQTPDQQITEIRDTQLGNVLGRLEALRTGAAGPGLSVAGLSVEAGDAILLATGDRRLLFADGDGLRMSGQGGDAVLAGQGGDLAGGRLGLFLTGSFKFGDKDDTDELEGYDFHTSGVTAGADYRLTDQLVFGGAFGYSRFDADFDDTEDSPGGQELESNSYLFSLFGTYFLDNGFFIDGIATVGYGDYESTRRVVVPMATPAVDEEAEGDFDAWQYGAAANVGYDTFVGPVRLTPRAQLEYLHADIDGFTEDGVEGLNLEFDDQDVDSLVIRPGVEAAYPISLDFGVISPYVWAEYIHEFLDDDDGVEVRFAADPTNLSAFEITTQGQDQNYGAVGAGVTATLRGGLSLFAGYETLVGLDDFDVHRISVGLRKELF